MKNQSSLSHRTRKAAQESQPSAASERNPLGLQNACHARLPGGGFFTDDLQVIRMKMSY